MSGDFEYQWGQMVARAWADPEVKTKLLADPVGVMREVGLEPPPGRQIRVVEDTGDVLHLVLPSKPSAQALSEEELHGGGGGYGAESCFRCGESCFRCAESCRRCGEECHRCERC